MPRKRRSGGSGESDASQLLIDWQSHTRTPTPVRHDRPQNEPAVPALVQVLPWDFTTTFPEPLAEAIDAGVIDESDIRPENLKSLHENYARQCLSTLDARDKVMDARRKGVDPETGNRPRTHASHERLRKYLAEEPARLDHTFDVLIGTYGDAFGQEAADAFRKAVVAWHAGIEVTREAVASAAKPVVQKSRKARASSCLPVPKPLASSVAAGTFGRDDNGKPIRPDADEVRAITESHADRMIEMDNAELHAAVAKYAEDFGPKAASQLERYVRRKRDDQFSR